MADKNTDQLKIIPTRKDNSPRIFSNYVRAVSTPIDVTLQFSDVKPPQNDDEQEKIKKNKIIDVLIEAEIVLPIAVAKELANILIKHLEKNFKKK